MTDLNKVFLIGRITHNVEVKYTKSGMAIADFSLANNQAKKNAQGNWENETSFFNLILCGKIAENLKQYLTKGKKIAVAGLLKQNTWTNQQGTKQSKVVIVVQEINLLDNSQKTNSNQNQQNQNQRSANQNQQNQNTDFYPKLEDDNFQEDIPF